MLLLDISLRVISNSQPSTDESHSFLKLIGLIAPPLSVLASTASLFLAYKVYRYTRRKNDNDVKIKWFQELIYTPNKDKINGYFERLYQIQDKVVGLGLLTDQTKIDIMNILKLERQQIVSSFVDLIKPISNEIHNSVFKAIEELTDKLTNTFDNDNLNLSDAATYQSKVNSLISVARNEMIISLFNYKG